MFSQAAMPSILLPRAFTASTTLQPWPAGQSGIPEVRSGNKQQRSPSPPLFTLFAEAESSRTGRDRRLRREEATQTITEECERLFCDALRGTFLVEREVSGQGSLVMDASRSKVNRANTTATAPRGKTRPVEAWVEVWDYGSDISFRGFVTGGTKDKAMFVFFEQADLEKDLKSGLISLMELAPNFNCTHMVACLDRSLAPADLDKLVRNFGWIGFGLTTLDTWAGTKDTGDVISDRWLFLDVEV